MMLRSLREEVLEANLELVRRGLVRQTFGNASGIDRARGLIVIKPSGVAYEKLAVDDLVLVDLEGRVVEGNMRPSSDTPTHLVLYRASPNVGGVVHTHSTYATAWAQAERSIPCFGTTHADYAFGEIPCTPVLDDERIGARYEAATGELIVETLRSFPTESLPSMVLVARHGPFAWGKDAGSAARNAEILEEVAKIAFLTAQLEPRLAPMKDALLRKHFFRKHGQSATYGQRQALGLPSRPEAELNSAPSSTETES